MSDTSGGWNDTSQSSSGDSGPTFTSSRITGYGQDEANATVLLKRGGQRNANVMNYMGPVGPSQTADQSVPLWQAMTGFESTEDPQQIITMQRKLYAGGFYKGLLKNGEQPQWGLVDEDTMNAYGKAVRETVRRKNLTLDEVIDAHIGATAGSTAAAKQQKLTNTENVKDSAKAVAQQLLGREPGADLLQQVADRYEQQAQQASNEGVAMDPVSPNQAWLAEQVKQLMPNTYKSYQTFQGVAGLQNMIGRPINNLLSNG